MPSFVNLPIYRYIYPVSYIYIYPIWNGEGGVSEERSVWEKEEWIIYESSLPAGRWERVIDNEERIGQRHGTAWTMRLRSWWKVRVSAGKGCPAQRLLEFNEKTIYNKWAWLRETNQRWHSTPQLGAVTSPWPEGGKGERTWGDRCMERPPWQEHRQTMVTWERGSPRNKS